MCIIVVCVCGGGRGLVPVFSVSKTPTLVVAHDKVSVVRRECIISALSTEMYARSTCVSVVCLLCVVCACVENRERERERERESERER